MKMDNNKYEIQIIITPIQSQPTTFISYDATTIWNGVLDICFFLDIYARA